MAVVFPDWYQEGFPDVEYEIVQLLTTYANLITPAGFVCTWLPEDLYGRLDNGQAVVRVYRGGPGAADDRAMMEYSSVQVAVLAHTRSDSWRVMEFCRQMILSYDKGGMIKHNDGSPGTAVQSVVEHIGPQQLPEENPDERLVQTTFDVQFRKPRNVPNYALIREQLNL